MSGYFRQTVAELVEKRSAAKKLRREMEMKKKQTSEETNKPRKDEDETDQEQPRQGEGG